MKALYYDGHDVSLREMPDPRPHAGEALIEVIYAGICNTDLEITKGYMDYVGVLGHEFVGRVVECDHPEWLGQRVVGEINWPCGKCAICHKGLPRHCPNRLVLGILGKHGCLAHYTKLPVANLHRVPQNISDKSAVFVEPLAAAFRIIEQEAVTPQDRVLVLGEGKLGQLIARVLHGRCRELHVVGKHQNKLMLLTRLGITAIHLEDFVPEDLKPQELYDAVIEATGSPASFSLAMNSLRPQGRLILKSTFHGGMEFQPAPLVINEITLIGSRCGPFAPALAALAKGEIEVEDLISDVLPLEEGLAAFAKAQQPGIIKILVDCRN